MKKVCCSESSSTNIGADERETKFAYLTGRLRSFGCRGVTRLSRFGPSPNRMPEEALCGTPHEEGWITRSANLFYRRIVSPFVPTCCQMRHLTSCLRTCLCITEESDRDHHTELQIARVQHGRSLGSSSFSFVGKKSMSPGLSQGSFVSSIDGPVISLSIHGWAKGHERHVVEEIKLGLNGVDVMVHEIVRPADVLIMFHDMPGGLNVDQLLGRMRQATGYSGAQQVILVFMHQLKSGPPGSMSMCSRKLTSRQKMSERSWQMLSAAASIVVDFVYWENDRPGTLDYDHEQNKISMQKVTGHLEDWVKGRVPIALPVPTRPVVPKLGEKISAAADAAVAASRNLLDPLESRRSNASSLLGVGTVQLMSVEGSSISLDSPGSDGEISDAVCRMQMACSSKVGDNNNAGISEQMYGYSRATLRGGPDQEMFPQYEAEHQVSTSQNEPDAWVVSLNAQNHPLLPRHSLTPDRQYKVKLGSLSRSWSWSGWDLLQEEEEMECLHDSNCLNKGEAADSEWSATIQRLTKTESNLAPRLMPLNLVLEGLGTALGDDSDGDKRGRDSDGFEEGSTLTRRSIYSTASSMDFTDAEMKTADSMNLPVLDLGDAFEMDLGWGMAGPVA